jgi:hypothetical protein
MDGMRRLRWKVWGSKMPRRQGAKCLLVVFTIAQVDSSISTRTVRVYTYSTVPGRHNQRLHCRNGTRTTTGTFYCCLLLLIFFVLPFVFFALLIAHCSLLIAHSFRRAKIKKPSESKPLQVRATTGSKQGKKHKRQDKKNQQQQAAIESTRSCTGTVPAVQALVVPTWYGTVCVYSYSSRTNTTVYLGDRKNYEETFCTLTPRHFTTPYLPP